MIRTLIILFLLLPRTVFAQFSISGRVLNERDGQPVVNASVFLNNATIGGTTVNDGVFKLNNVKPGKYELIVSIIGYSLVSRSINIDNADLLLPDIYLQPQTVLLNEVKITSKEDPDRKRNIDLFKSVFFGNPDQAKGCKLVNPELLDLSYDEKTKTLVANSTDFLIVENKTLGYRVKYLLSNFTLNNDQNAGQFYYEGSVLFEELKGTAFEEEQWRKRRRDIYANSSAHFFRAAINKQLDQEGFTVLRFQLNPQRPADSIINAKIKVFAILKDQRRYRDSLSHWMKKSKMPKLLPKQIPAAVTNEELIEKTGKPGLYVLRYHNDAFYVVYNKSHQFNASSLSHLYDRNNISSTLVNFNAPLVYFDRNGTINNPGSLTYSGVWANKRVSELLPLDYEPEPAEQPIDSSLFKKVNDKLEAYKSGHPIEKVYLHFDKPYYAAGDTIYFKAYVIDPTYKPSVLSSLLNAELISPDNTICQSIKLKLADCTAAGDFALPDTLPEGYYRLRAYTNVMRNAGEEYFFEKYMFIVNNPKNVLSRGKERYNTNTADGNIVSSNSSTAIDKIDVQFFPEGGKLINGAASKIAFKAVGPNGLGIEIKGTVTDDQGHQLAVFTSQHLGMGLIEMTPETGRVYKANISYIGGSKTYELPEADDNGYSLVIDNTDSRNIGINVTSGLQNQQRQIYLVAQSGGVIYFYTPGTLVNRKFATIIPKSMFPDGIVQFTLFSAKGEPANERLVFIRNPAQLNLKLTSDRSVYQARQKTIINLEARDKDYKPITGNFSVSVTNETEVPVDTDNESTIFANLLLTSDLKGYVEKPNYYFKDESAKANSDLDVLLLTQGYHRFEWQQILTGRYPQTTFESEKTTTITGVLKNLNGKSVPYGKVSLLSVSKVFFSLDTVADGNGNFQFKHFPAIDGIRYIIQATDKELRKNTWVKIDEATPPELNKSKNVPDRHISPAGDQLSYLNFANNFHQEQLKLGIGKHAIALKEVVIKNKIKPKYLEHSSNLNGAGNANQVITADQLPRGCPVLTDCIAGRMGRIHFSKGTPYLIGMIGHNESAVFIDGVEITVPKTIDGMGPTKADVINSINVGDVASIEIITDASLAAIYGLRGGGGVILITTKRWDDVTPGIGNPRTHYVYYSPTAYYKARTFYSPRYDSSKINTPFADLRATIYWNPNVIVDKDGNAFLNFFNADTKGTYRVVIEGIDEKGNIGRQVYRYKVE